MAKWKEVRCEVCGEPVDLLADYASILSGRALRPREYVEEMLNMSDEEKAARTTFFTELFMEHNARKATSGNELQTA